MSSPTRPWRPQPHKTRPATEGGRTVNETKVSGEAVARWTPPSRSTASTAFRTVLTEAVWGGRSEIRADARQGDHSEGWNSSARCSPWATPSRARDGRRFMPMGRCAGGARVAASRYHAGHGSREAFVAARTLTDHGKDRAIAHEVGLARPEQRAQREVEMGDEKPTVLFVYYS